ncbi:Protein of unknown function, partial [Gryllus bimaculatus]
MRTARSSSWPPPPPSRFGDELTASLSLDSRPAKDRGTTSTRAPHANGEDVLTVIASSVEIQLDSLVPCSSKFCSVRLRLSPETR